MFKLTRVLFLAAALSLVAAACGDDEADDTTTTAAADDGATTTAADDETATSAAEEATDDSAAAEEEGEDTAAGSGDLQVTSSDLGEILVDADGNTIYLYTPDEQGESTCYDACAEAWPVVGELATVGAGLDESLLGSITRTDGVVQATYNDWPLYYFASDTGPGDTAGQGVGDVWYVVDATGSVISS
jgi:predicted lipoprotein with Yx(FWY)xxD motif